MPSLQPGGTKHSVEGETWDYYIKCMLLYTLPWSLLPIVQFIRGPRRLWAPAGWRLAAVWIVLTVTGASLTSREASRYLFQIYVATSLLVALAIGREMKPALARIISILLLLTLPVQVLRKSAFHERDKRWAAVKVLESHRSDPVLAGRVIHGPFGPEQQTVKSLLRFHLGVPVSSAPVTDMRGLQWIPPDNAGFPKDRVVVSTPLGTLVDFDRP
jgi:hypothetical protein